MIGRRGVFGGVAAVGLLSMLLGGCGDTPSVTYRQKMTVEVETPEGIKTGSAVSEVRVSKAGAFETRMGEGGDRRILLAGEAVAVDVAPGKTLYALLVQPPEGGDNYRGDIYMPDLIPYGLLLGGKASSQVTIVQRPVEDAQAVAQSRVKVELPNSFYPLLVTFGDNSDPTSVKRVEPSDLAASFGKGVKLRAITVEVTDEPVTTEIKGRLTWLPKVYDVINGREFKPEGIPVGDFQRLFSTEQF